MSVFALQTDRPTQAQTCESNQSQRPCTPETHLQKPSPPRFFSRVCLQHCSSFLPEPSWLPFSASGKMPMCLSPCISVQRQDSLSPLLSNRLPFPWDHRANALPSGPLCSSLLIDFLPSPGQWAKCPPLSLQLTWRLKTSFLPSLRVVWPSPSPDCILL